MRKQLGSLVVAAALVFAGCGGGQEPTADQLEQMSDSTTTTSPEDDVVTEVMEEPTPEQLKQMSESTTTTSPKTDERPELPSVPERAREEAIQGSFGEPVEFAPDVLVTIEVISSNFDDVRLDVRVDNYSDEEVTTPRVSIWCGDQEGDWYGDTYQRGQIPAQTSISGESRHSHYLCDDSYILVETDGTQVAYDIELTGTADPSTLRSALIAVLSEDGDLTADQAVCVVDELFEQAPLEQITRMGFAESEADLTEEDLELLFEAIFLCL